MLFAAGNVDLTQQETMFNYTWQMFMGGCRFWNHENETWDSDGCVVSNRRVVNFTFALLSFVYVFVLVKLCYCLTSYHH